MPANYSPAGFDAQRSIGTDEQEWRNIPDPKERRKIQNRLAQRRRRHKELLRKRATADDTSKTPSVSNPSDKDEDEDTPSRESSVDSAASDREGCGDPMACRSPPSSNRETMFTSQPIEGKRSLPEPPRPAMPLLQDQTRPCCSPLVSTNTNVSFQNGTNHIQSAPDTVNFLATLFPEWDEPHSFHAGVDFSQASASVYNLQPPDATDFNVQQTAPFRHF